MIVNQFDQVTKRQFMDKLFVFFYDSDHQVISTNLEISIIKMHRNEPGPSNGGGKRGRDDRDGSRKRRDDSRGRPNKVPKVDNKQNGSGRKKREEFIDQPVTREEGYDKRGDHRQGDVEVNVVANFFRVDSKKISVTKYRVDFDPECEIPALRRALIRQHKRLLGFFVYDGANEVYLLRPLAESPLELQSQSREGSNYKVKFRQTTVVHYTEAAYLQVLNLILRNGMRGLNLQLVGRNFYDVDPRVVVS